MPYLKTETIFSNNGVKTESFKVRISVSADGEFYCHAPSYLSLSAPSYFAYQFLGNVDNEKGTIKLTHSSLKELVEALTASLKDYTTPITTLENVIHYNIESHISFAENENGEIFPNAGFNGASWLDLQGKQSNSKYGNIHSSQQSKGGYSLTIGAIAFTKKTVSYGEQKKVTYSKYYKDDSHLTTDNPASLLNSWVNFHFVNNRYKEIPYTDKAATFFHNLMMGMAKLSKLIQDHTFDDEQLNNLIESGSHLLGDNTKTLNG